MEGDIAIVDGVRVRGLVHTKAMKSSMLQGKFIVPGFIDGHVHIESSMLTPTNYQKSCFNME